MSLSKYQNGKFIKSHDPGLKGPEGLKKPDEPDKPDEPYFFFSRVSRLSRISRLLNEPDERDNQMNLIFAFLSVAYIFVIFFFADSSAASAVAPYNPFSLLHIPLYGILTVLIVFALVPFNSFPFSRIRAINRNESSVTNSINATNARNRFLIAGLISILVALADEYHQTFIPTREGSFTDVLLDVAGIALAILFTFRLYRMQRTYIKKWTHYAKTL